MSSHHGKMDAALADACILLGLAPPVTADQAKARYRELAKIYHPDVGSAKNSARFAEISKAYDLVQEHTDRLSVMKLGLVTDVGAHGSQLADVLEQLREARTKNLVVEQKLQQFSAESDTLRAYIAENRSGSLWRLLGKILAVLAALVLGFVAGMLWSAEPVQLPLIPSGPVRLVAATTNTMATVPLQGAPGFLADVSVSGETLLELRYTEGTITKQGVGATVQTSPTAEVIQLPAVSATLRQVQDISPTPAAVVPSPTPTPVIPAPPDQLVTTRSAQQQTTASATSSP